MSQKRKIEEFHDPDYPAQSLPKKKANVDLSPEERLSKIRSIIKREFQKELAAKEQEVMKIDSSITMTRKLLQRIRYAVVANYYNIKAAEIADTEQKSQNPEESEETPKAVQEPIHPALKSIIGKKPVNYDDILKSRPTREAFKVAKTTIAVNLRAKKEEKRLQRQELIKSNEVVTDETTIKVPRYVDPVKEEQKIPQLNMARGRHQTKHLIVVGNTSKFIGNEAINTNITHKWLVYVTTKTSVPVEKLVTKVKFLLHPSYKPNDIVDVCAPPFQLSRRGWGEFPIRVQLFFNPKLQQKPVQLVHNLVLDKTLSGLQTMGAETLVEMWLNFEPLDENSTSDLDNGLPNEVQQDTINETTETEECTQNNLLENTQTNDDVFIKKEIKQEPAEDYPTVPISESFNQNRVEDHNSSNDLNITPCQDKKIIKLNLGNISNLATKPESHSENTFQKKIFKCIGRDGKVKFVEIFVKQANVALNKSITLNGQIDTDKKPSSNLMPITPNDSQNQPVRKIILKSNSIIPNSGIINLQSKLTVPISNLPRQDSSQTEEKSRNADVEPNVRTPFKDVEKGNTEIQSKNQVVLKNGKMYIIDPVQTKLKKQIKKQQSLLKPQISLLKPIVKNDNFQNCMRNNILNNTSVATDHDYTNLTGKASMPNTIKYHRPLSITPHNSNNSSRSSLNKGHKSIVTVNGPSNKPINIILTKMKADNQPSVNQKPIALMKRTRIDYRKQLEEEFFNRKFHSIRHAVEYLLRKIPLINPLASSSDYQTSFPFVVPSEKALSELALPKRRSNEWILARYISAAVKKYFSAIEIRKWTTKEIILFGRYHAYTPVMLYSKSSDEQPDKSSEGSNLKEIIKKEITKEKYFGQTLSLNHPIYKWINETKEKISTDFSSTDDVIDVDSVDNEDTKPSYLKHYDTQMKSCEGKQWLPVNSELENEVKFVNECSQQIGIRFPPEEIEPGVMHSSAQVILASALKSFVEEILRRSLYLNIESQDFRNQKQLDLRPENVREAISNRIEFEFLTNKHLGVANLKEQLD